MSVPTVPGPAGRTGMAIGYLRNGVLGWSRAAQEAALRQAEGFDLDQLYQDRLTPAQAKKPSEIRNGWLPERQRLFGPHGAPAGSTVVVATLLAIITSEADLIDILVQAKTRDISILALDSGFRVETDRDLIGAKETLEDWRRAKQEARTRPGRAAGNRAAAVKRRQLTLDLLPKAAPLWLDDRPNRLTPPQVAERIGLSAKTLRVELGPRPAINRAGEGR